MVFVLVDDVFVVLFEGIVELLLEVENKDQFLGILIYYVVVGKVDVVIFINVI